jgi:hypothetical protein
MTCGTGVVPELGAWATAARKLAGHLGGNLNAGQAAADHHHGILPVGAGLKRQGGDVLVQPGGGLVGINIESVFHEAG